ncbi:MAG: peptidylprolyl isomerase, partial [Planctomycetota bacterium]
MLHALRHRRPLISAAAATRPLFTERLEERRLLVAPEVGAIGDVALPAGHAIQVPINGFDADGDALTYSVTSSTPALIPAFRDSGNTWIEMDVTWTDADDVARSGTMVYQLFDQATPVTVRTIRGFVESGFYDGLTFHRAVDGFTIQGGDAAGVGNGDVDNDGISDFTDILFEDELQPELLFSGEGQLAMANSGFDTNSTQFFVTFGPTRSLDYNHTIFGQLVRGFDVSDAISKVPVTANPLSFEQSFPVDPVTIVDARVVENTQDAVLQVRSDGTTGSGTLVVTATDTEGNQTSREVVVNVNEDLNNFNIENDQPPILGPLSDFRSAVGETIVLDIPAFDFEGDDFEIGGRFITQFEDENFPDNSILQTEKQITLTPRGGYVGPIEITVGVKQVNTTARGSTNENPNDTFNIFDKQTITIAVGDENLDATGTSLAAVPGTQVDGVVATFTHADPLSAADEFSALI